MILISIVSLNLRSWEKEKRREEKMFLYVKHTFFSPLDNDPGYWKLPSLTAVITAFTSLTDDLPMFFKMRLAWFMIHEQ